MIPLFSLDKKIIFLIFNGLSSKFIIPLFSLDKRVIFLNYFLVVSVSKNKDFS